MQQLNHAIASLEQALVSPTKFQHSWRHLVRTRVRRVDRALSADRNGTSEAWLSPRADTLRRERVRLLDELTTISLRISEPGNAEPLRADLRRLVQDLQHHQQRVNDLAYDAVAMDVGGSE